MKYFKELTLLIVFFALIEANAFDFQTERALGKIDEGALAMGYLAKETCSCIFVTGQSEDYCKEYNLFGALKDIKANIRIDYRNKTVRASTFLVIAKRAKYQSDKLGCQLVR